MENLFHKVSFKTSELTTKTYSTSFSSAVRMLSPDIRKAVYSIYGFVRFADEIVDTFHDYDKKFLLEKFENDYYEALKLGISVNPIIHSFQITVNKYNIPDKYIQAFLKSMRDDLDKKEYEDKKQIDEYIYGSADVVGLMCLRIFCNGNDTLFDKLEHSAKRLGSAFQKVNFLRDLRNDMEDLGRRYFPEVDKNNFTEESKMEIIADIENDLRIAYQGIRQLPKNSRLAVMLAFIYYKKLLEKIKRTPARKIINRRIRISNPKKLLLMNKVVFMNKLNIL